MKYTKAREALARRPPHRRRGLAPRRRTGRGGARPQAERAPAPRRGATPRLDALARRSALFERAWSQAPVSLPSHATVMTGLFPRAHAAWGARGRVDPAAHTLAETLAAAGWRTAAFTGGFSVQGAFGLARGFERYEDQDARAPLSVTVPAAREWLRGLKPEEPFFLFVHGYDAHPPYRAERRELTRFDPDYRGAFARLNVDHGLTDRLCGLMLHEAPGCAGPAVPLQPADLEHLRALYAGAVAAADRRVGELLDELERQGRARDTVVVLFSDHGELIEDHEHVLLSPELFDDSLRVPLLVSAPGLRPRRVASPAPSGPRFGGDWGVAMSKLYHGVIPEDFRAFFDRDPERTPPSEPGVVVAPADGIVLDALEGPTTSLLVISLGMTDVHVQRAPLPGRVLSTVEEGTEYLATSDPRHLGGNVRKVTAVDSPIGRYVLTQITGLWTKRISVYPKPGEQVALGQRFGRIMLGSTVTLQLPAKAKLSVRRYDRVWGGESVVARY
jgi:phosphatidylserine decarboxylase